MIFPPKPTCHEPMGSVFRYGNEFAWRDPKPMEGKGNEKHVIHHARTCDYCGSIHPEDLMKIEGLKLSLADFKYGWPHKFYIEEGTLNGQPVWGKWYNAHLQDEGMDDETFNALCDLLFRACGHRVAFGRNEKGVWFKCL